MIQKRCFPIPRIRGQKIISRDVLADRKENDMRNEEMMTINLSRIKVLDVEMSIQNVIFDLEDDIKSNETSEDRKKIAQSSIEHRWKPLLEAIKKQFEEHDK